MKVNEHLKEDITEINSSVETKLGGARAWLTDSETKSPVILIVNDFSIIYNMNG